MNQTEQISASFYAWEERGRGWAFYDAPVDIEPPCEPFEVQFTNVTRTDQDDGRVPSIFKRIGQLFSNDKHVNNDVEESNQVYPYQAYLDDNSESLKSFLLSVPNTTSFLADTSEQFLNILSSTKHQLAFEVVGTSDSIQFQFTCRESDASYLVSQLKTYFSQVAIKEIDTSGLPINLNTEVGIVDLGLEQEFYRPLKTFQKTDPDPFLGLVGVFENLSAGETAIVQIVFKGSKNPWAYVTTDAVSDGQGGSFFIDAPEAPSLAREKVDRLMYSVVLRAVAQGTSVESTRQITDNLVGALTIQSRSSFNSLIPLRNEGYPYEQHLQGVLERKSCRLGMLLNSGELASFVHLPSPSISSQKLDRQQIRTKQAPKELLEGAYSIGMNEHIGSVQNVFLKDEHRLRHTHVIGATGVGKSTFLANSFLNDIKQGNGCAMLDPHGDTVDDIISRIPSNRLQDVILIDPADMDFPIGFNIFQASTDIEKIVLSSDLVETFRARSTSWGDTMTSVLANAINAFLESDKGGTLLDLKRFLTDTTFRNTFLESVPDPSVRYYWNNDFGQLRKGSISPLLTRIDTFLRPRLVRNMMAQQDGIDFHEILNKNKIVLVKLAQGLIGEDNSYVLGTLILAKLYQAAQARQALSKDERTPFYLYIDEFHHFITPSLSAILSGARKYGFGLVLAHQEMNQVASQDSSVANSVLSNPGIRICFRLGDADANKLQSGFQSFEANDFQALGTGEAIVRVGRSNYDFNLRTEPLSNESNSHNHDIVVQNTRNLYAASREEVEDIVNKSIGNHYPKHFSQEVEKQEVLDTSKEDKVLPTKEVIEQHSKKDISESAKEYVEEAKQSRQQKEHNYLKSYIKQMAEQRGFKVETEVAMQDGGRIDAVLISDELKIACEISVTNTVGYEVQNIQKCINAGYAQVIMLSQNPEHLKLIQESAGKKLSDHHLNQVKFLNTEELLSALDSTVSSRTKRETRTRGYRVKTNYKTSEKSQDVATTIKNTVIKTLKKK